MDKPLKFSPQQTTVLDWVSNGTGSAFVEAVAGAGKTTTLVEACQRMDGSVAFAAFNKKIADEIKERVAPMGLGNRVKVGTFHSFGFGAWRRVAPNVKAGPQAAQDKWSAIVADLEIPEAMQSFVKDAVSLAKQRVIGLLRQDTDMSAWYEIVDHHDLIENLEDADDLEKALEFSIRALRYGRDMARDIIDFDDMLYMPIVTKCRIWENDWLIVDEAQDTNPARRTLARRMLRARGRSLWVGDTHQAIYGFQGADADAVAQIMEDFNCSSLPLTTTFRCPKAVVEAAQEYVSHIQAADEAPEGEVISLGSYEDLTQAKDLIPDDAILCRKMAPLVNLAFALIRRGIGCHVEGRDIGQGLLNLIKRYKVTSIDKLRDRLDVYVERETEKLKAKNKNTQAETLADRVATVFALCQGLNTVAELRDRITEMFKDSDNGGKGTLTLATVHRSKGREWDRVFLLGQDKWMPSGWARQQWELDQENNLIYVAYTRAKQILVHVPAPTEEPVTLKGEELLDAVKGY